MASSGITLVTGGAGFIGSHLAAALAQRGARVRIIDDLSTGRRENLEGIKGDIDFIQASLVDMAATRRILLSEGYPCPVSGGSRILLRNSNS